MAYADKFRIEYSDNTSDTVYLLDHYSYEKAMNVMTGVKCLLIGNSYNDGIGGIAGQGWGFYFTQNTGCDSVIIAQNGGDFAAVGNANADYPNYTYADVIDDVAGGMTVSDRNLYRYIIVAGGYNDGSTVQNPGGYDDTVAGINSFCAKAKNYFPNARIMIIPVTANAGMNGTFRQGCPAGWNAGAVRNGCYTCDSSIGWFYGRSDLTAGDNMHLNDAGYKRLAQYIEALIYGWQGNVYWPAESVTQGANTTSVSIREQIDNNSLVQIHGSCTGTYTSFDDVLFNIKEQYRPMATLYTVGWFFGTSPNRGIIPIEVRTNGDVRMRADSSVTLSGTITVYLNISYIRNW